MSKKPPERLMETGVSAPRLESKAGIRVQSYTSAASGLTNYPKWWLGSADNWREVEVEQSQAQGADVVAKLAGCNDRDVAASFKGQQVAIPRDAFPPAEKGEYYWADLVGLRVKNNEGLDFGVVAS